VLIRHLAYFVTLAEEKHFARAAEICNVAQPTLSAAIRKLEEDLAVTLIIRGNRFTGLTPEGERALEWGRQILLDHESMLKDVNGSHQGVTGRLRLGVIPAAMPSSALVSDLFCRRNPGATIDIRSMTSRDIQHGLDTFELDGALTYLENEPLEHVRRMPLYRERYVFICRADHALASRSSLTWAEAAAERLCLLSEDMQNRRILDAIAALAGVVIRPTVVSNSFLAVCAHVQNGSWSSIVPHTFPQVFGDTASLAVIEMSDQVQTQAIGLVTSDRSPQSPMTRALLSALDEYDFGSAFEVAAQHA
jgi:DNA-binding transcriptional LysR family regulator